MENPKNSNLSFFELNSILKLAVFLFLFSWLSIQILTPYLLPAHSITNLSGMVGIQNQDSLLQQISFPGNIVYRAGDYMCHQRADRSLFINGNQMPFCSRCTAIWIGLTAGILLTVSTRIRLSEKILYVMILAIIPIGIDGIGQLIGLWESTNLIRLITGIITGSACGIALGVIIDEIIPKPHWKT